MKFRRRLLPAERSLPCDIVHFARQVPVARAEAELDLGEVAAARSQAEPRVSWTALFVKAQGLVAERHEWLRQTFLRWPIPHVFEHEQSTAMVAVQREYQGRPRLCFGRLVDPARRSLVDLQQHLDHYAHGPVEEVFRKQLRLSRLPWPVRRMAWWVTLNLAGPTRARQVGTFSLSSLAGQGVNNRDHPTLCTSSLSYGPLDAAGRALVTLIYDHRLADGRQASDVLHELRRTLHSSLLAELHQLRRSRAA